MKFKKSELRAEEDLVRYCSKCRTELPSNHKQKNCDSCNREDANKMRNGIFAVIGSGLILLGKVVLPKIIKK